MHQPRVQHGPHAAHQQLSARRRPWRTLTRSKLLPISAALIGGSRSETTFMMPLNTVFNKYSVTATTVHPTSSHKGSLSSRSIGACFVAQFIHWSRSPKAEANTTFPTRLALPVLETTRHVRLFQVLVNKEISMNKTDKRIVLLIADFLPS